MAAEEKRAALSNVDTAWLHMEAPNNLMMITGVFIFDRPLDFERLKAILDHRFRPFDRFRQRIVEPRFGLGSPHWEADPTYDISNHVHRIALPAPGDQAALQELVSDLTSTPLDFSKPLWQYHLVEGYGDGCALIARLHHCIGDGIALMRVLLSITDESPDASLELPEMEGREKRSWNPFRVITRPAWQAVGATRRMTGSLLTESWEMLTNPGHALDLARLGTETTMALGRLLLLPPDPKTLFKGPLGVQKRVAWSQAIPLDDVKAICRATDTTVNDVLMTAVAGALGSYLQRQDQAVGGLNFRAVIPVNLREDSGAVTLGNRFGLVFLSLPVGTADPLARLFEVKRRMDQLKGTPEALVAFGILVAIGMAPTEIENIVVNIFGTKATAVMTNVPGPRQKLYFAGGGIDQLMFWVPQSGRLGLGISIFSYNNQVWLGVATDVGLVPDPQTIVEDFHGEMQELCQLAGVLGEERRARRPVTARPLGQDGSDNLTRIRGIGPSFAAQLESAGIRSFAALAGLSPERLAEIVDAPDWRRPDYQAWIEQAATLDILPPEPTAPGSSL